MIKEKRGGRGAEGLEEIVGPTAVPFVDVRTSPEDFKGIRYEMDRCRWVEY
jgi:hypothetical protein